MIRYHLLYAIPQPNFSSLIVDNTIPNVLNLIMSSTTSSNSSDNINVEELVNRQQEQDNRGRYSKKQKVRCIRILKPKSITKTYNKSTNKKTRVIIF